MGKTKRRVVSGKSLLNKKKFEMKWVELEGFEDGDGVYVRELYGIEKESFELALMAKQSKENKKAIVKGTIAPEDVMEDAYQGIKSLLAASCMCDEEGTLLFPFEDLQQLQQNADELNRMILSSDLEKIVEEANNLNRVSETDKEELEKN